MRFGTLFSGGEGVGVGLTTAGLSHAWGIEYDPAIAAVAQANGFNVHVADVRAVDYAALERVDWLHASPSCTRASVANSGATEAAEDIEAAQAVVRALCAQGPQIFTLENVWQYRTFAAFRLICDELGRLGYFWTYDHVNCADMGVPQTRKRLLLRASRGLLPLLSEPVPWVGWYAAIEDLIPTLPESRLAPWQLARLPDGLRETVLVDGFGNTSREMTVLQPSMPCLTVQAWHGRRPVQAPRAVLVAGLLNNNNQKDVRACLGAHVVAMTPRCLARFQSVPDSYWLPEGRTLAALVVGNMVPPLLMQRIAEGFQP